MSEGTPHTLTLLEYIEQTNKEELDEIKERLVNARLDVKEAIERVKDIEDELRTSIAVGLKLASEEQDEEKCEMLKKRAEDKYDVGKEGSVIKSIQISENPTPTETEVERYYDGILCTCKAVDCPKSLYDDGLYCKGECGCDACQASYADEMSNRGCE